MSERGLLDRPERDHLGANLAASTSATPAPDHGAIEPTQHTTRWHPGGTVPDRADPVENAPGYHPAVPDHIGTAGDQGWPAWPSAPSNGPTANPATGSPPQYWPDRSYERLPRPGQLHYPVGPDPVAAYVILTVSVVVVLVGVILFFVVSTAFR
jgi:hypothetical protein